MKKRKFNDGGMPDDTYAKAIAEGRESEQDSAKTTPAKQRIVSKKELADSGLSLRDFLNKERGLTRRKSAADKEDEAPAKRPAMESEAPAKRPGMMARLRADSAVREAAAKRMREETPDLSMPNRSTDNPMGKNYGAGRVNPSTLLPYKKGGSIKKYASGGSVSSASSRADGIATKGKTKCRIV